MRTCIACRQRLQPAQALPGAISNVQFNSSSPGGFGARPALGKVRTRAAAGGIGSSISSSGGGGGFPLEAHWTRLLEQVPSHSQPLLKAAIVGLIIVVVLMAGIICVALVSHGSRPDPTRRKHSCISVFCCSVSLALTFD